MCRTAADSLFASSSARVEADAKAIAADHDSPDWVPRFEESDLPTAASAEVGHPGDRSSASGLAWSLSPPHLQSTAQNPVLPGAARTSVHIRWPPSPRER